MAECHCSAVSAWVSMDCLPSEQLNNVNNQKRHDENERVPRPAALRPLDVTHVPD
jgi:hypothetical protein